MGLQFEEVVATVPAELYVATAVTADTISALGVRMQSAEQHSDHALVLRRVQIWAANLCHVGAAPYYTMNAVGSRSISWLVRVFARFRYSQSSAEIVRPGAGMNTTGDFRRTMS